MNDRDIVSLPHHAIERDPKVDDLQLVLDERSTCIPISSAQLKMSALDSALRKQFSAEVAERVHHRCGA
ncbi:hypothetical protein XH87_07660 [Bradyrhizobium sp. CCBAU 53415]|nr:hypothetical protein [Bradyrhizobium sp. CCBAU 53415]